MKNTYRLNIFLAVVTGLAFALLPLAAGLLTGQELIRFALVSCLAFMVLTFLFTAICDRLASGTAGKAAPALSAGVLFLAVQGCSGLFL